jgi:hypothetical protein
MAIGDVWGNRWLGSWGGSWGQAQAQEPDDPLLMHAGSPPKQFDTIDVIFLCGLILVGHIDAER